MFIEIYFIAKLNWEIEKTVIDCHLKVIAFHQIYVRKDISQCEQETMMGKEDFVNKQGSKNNSNEKKRKTFKRDASQKTQIRISSNF